MAMNEQIEMPPVFSYLIALASSTALWGAIQYLAGLWADRKKREAAAQLVGADVSRVLTEVGRVSADTDGVISLQWQQVVKHFQETLDSNKQEAAAMRENAEEMRRQNQEFQRQTNDLTRRLDAMQIIIMDLLAGVEVTNRELVRLGGHPVWTPSVPDELILLAVGNQNVLEALKGRISQGARGVKIILDRESVETEAVDREEEMGEER